MMTSAAKVQKNADTGKFLRKIMRFLCNFAGIIGMILLFYLLYYFGGIAGNDHIVRDVMSDDRTGANDHTVTDGDTRTDNYSAAKPAVIANMNRQPCFYGLTASQIIMRMVGRQQLAVRPDEGVGTDDDTSAVQKDTVEIDHRTFAYADSVTMVAMEWGTNNHRRMCIRDEGFDTTV